MQAQGQGVMGSKTPKVQYIGESRGHGAGRGSRHGVMGQKSLKPYLRGHGVMGGRGVRAHGPGYTGRGS